MTTATVAYLRRGVSPQAALTLLVGLLTALLMAACVPQASASSSEKDEVASDAHALPTDDEDKPAAGDDDVSQQPGIAHGNGVVPPGFEQRLDHVSDVWQSYQWLGVVELSEAEGRYFVLNRGCDRWILKVGEDETALKLRKLTGSKALVWGRASDYTNNVKFRAIEVSAVFGPDEPVPQTLVAIPEYPCPGSDPKPTPVPAHSIELRQGEVAARGLLVWENWLPYLSTPSGRIGLILPAAAQTGEGATQADASSAQQLIPPGIDALATGVWSVRTTSLALSARALRTWPVRLSVPVTCESGAATNLLSVSVEPGEIAARGTLAQDGNRWYVKTSGGAVYLSLPLLAAEKELSGTPEVVATGKWALSAAVLSVSARQVIRTDSACPRPPFQPILPGEIAALGTLAWDNGQPYLETPSGKIALFRPNSTDAVTPAPAPAISYGDVLATPVPNQPVPVRQLVVVGKWSVANNGLSITVRYALPWPLQTPWDKVLPLPAISADGRLSATTTTDAPVDDWRVVELVPIKA